MSRKMYDDLYFNQESLESRLGEDPQWNPFNQPISLLDFFADGGVSPETQVGVGVGSGVSSEAAAKAVEMRTAEGMTIETSARTFGYRLLGAGLKIFATAEAAGNAGRVLPGKSGHGFWISREKGSIGGRVNHRDNPWLLNK